MPKKRIVFQKDAKSDLRVNGLRTIEAKQWPTFKVEVEIPDAIFKEIANDSVLLEVFNEEGQRLYKDYIDNGKKLLLQFDKLGLETADQRERDKLQKRLDEMLEESRKSFQTSASAGIKRKWEEYGKKKKEYLKYKIGIVASVAGSAAVLYTSVGLMATTPFTGGFSAAVAIVGMIKSVINITKEIISAWQDVEQAQTVLEMNLQILKKAAGSMLAKKMNEYAADVVKGFLGISQPSVDQCEKQLKTIKHKLSGIDIHLHDLSKRLNLLLDQQEKLKKEFMAEVNNRYRGNPNQNEIGTIRDAFEARITRSREGLIKGLEKIGKVLEGLKKAEQKTKELESELAPLLAVRNISNKVLGEFVALGSIALTPFHGNAIAREAADIAAGVAPAAADLAWDKFCSGVFKGTLLG